MNKFLEYRLEERVSKNGNTYTVLIVKLTPTFEKVVFLDSAEIELLKIYNNSLKK